MTDSDAFVGYSTHDDDEVGGHLDDGAPSVDSSLTERSRGFQSFQRSTSLHGRGTEVKLLQDAFIRVDDDHRHQPLTSSPSSSSCGNSMLLSSSEVVLIFGEAGTGKTALVEEALRNFVASKRNGRFVAGKFDQLQRTGESFSALVAALSDLCDILANDADKSDMEKEELERLLGNELGPEARYLTRLIPNLPFLMPSVEPLFGGEDRLESQHALVRLAQLARTFLQVIVSGSDDNNKKRKTKSIVLFIDDVQWADENSKQVIKSLVRNLHDVNHILLILASRSEPSLKDLSEPCKVAVTAIPIRNLDKVSLRGLVECMVDPHQRESLGRLAGDIHRKSKGNAFHAVQLLEQHKRNQQQQQHSNRRDGFTPPAVGITQSESDATTTIITAADDDDDGGGSRESIGVSALVEVKVRDLDDTTNTVLRLAAFLGFHFDVSILATLLCARDWHELLRISSDKSNKDKRVVTSDNHLEASLKVAVAEGLLLHDREDEHMYRFAHDNIQTCLYNMVEVRKERARVHLAIGRSLHAQGQEEHGRETVPLPLALVQLATDNMNHGSSQLQSDSEVLELVGLNIRSGKHALESGALADSLFYHRKAVELLTQIASPWKDHYKLCLQTFSCCGFLEYCNGNTEECMSSCQEVISHAKSLLEKIDVYTTMIVAVGNYGRNFKEAFRIGIPALRELGESFPRNAKSVHLVLELVLANRALGQMTDCDIMALPPMQNEFKIAAMTVMSKMVFAGFADQDSKILFLLVGLRMFRLTCLYGYTDWSAVAVSLYAGVQCALQSFQKGKRFLGIAYSMIQKLKSNEAKTCAIFCLHAAVSLWSGSITDALDGLWEGYRIGMECNSVHFALHSASVFSMVAFISDYPCSRIESILRDVCNQMREFRSEFILRVTLPMWQIMLNLMGFAEDPLQLTGEAMDEEKFTGDAVPVGDELSLFVARCFKCHLACCFDGRDLLESLLSGFAAQRVVAARGFFMMETCCFIQGLMAFTLWQKTKGRRFRREGIRCWRRLESWVTMGVGNCVPLSEMLKAETMAARSRNNQVAVKQQYDTAIAWAQQMKIPYWRLLFTKRAFDVFHDGHYCDSGIAGSYLMHATEAASQWGANGMEEFLRERRVACSLVGCERGSKKVPI